MWLLVWGSQMPHLQGGPVILTLAIRGKDQTSWRMDLQRLLGYLCPVRAQSLEQSNALQ